MGDLQFKPTKTWVKYHKYRPRECVCLDIPCYCILDHFNKHTHGFCVGIGLSEDDGLDMVRFCDRTYNPETNESYCTSRQWHPNEAQLVATYLSMGVISAWSLLPEYRKQLGKMGIKRTRQIKGKRQ